MKWKKQMQWCGKNNVGGNQGRVPIYQVGFVICCTKSQQWTASSLDFSRALDTLTSDSYIHSPHQREMLKHQTQNMTLKAHKENFIPILLVHAANFAEVNQSLLLWLWGSTLISVMVRKTRSESRSIPQNTFQIGTCFSLSEAKSMQTGSCMAGWPLSPLRENEWNRKSSPDCKEL